MTDDTDELEEKRADEDDEADDRTELKEDDDDEVEMAADVELVVRRKYGKAELDDDASGP
jgi:hypothetical protein